jgi:hypothetical protein
MCAGKRKSAPETYGRFVIAAALTFPPWVFFERHRLAMWVFGAWAPKSKSSRQDTSSPQHKEKLALAGTWIGSAPSIISMGSAGNGN